MTLPRFELTSQRQNASRPTEPPTDRLDSLVFRARVNNKVNSLEQVGLYIQDVNRLTDTTCALFLRWKEDVNFIQLLFRPYS